MPCPYGKTSATLFLMSIPQLVDRLDTWLTDEPPFTLTEGGMIRDGVSAELDELRAIARGGKEWIISYQQREIERTGISSLKVKFNKVFGYFIEVTSSHLHKIPENYHRKQTTVGGERFITPELKEYEEKVLTAEERICALEYRLFEELRKEIAAHASDIQEISDTLAELDVLASFAETAERNHFTRPKLNEKRGISIKNGRHPVVESLRGSFVGNDVCLSDKTSFIVLTGPNMAGKSTYLRQNALIVLLAQIGSFVPAESAEIGIVDRIFTRVGAGDNLAAGESTFLMEMQETSQILHHATERSLVILDEVGRGTSTYDGMALAWAISEHLAEQIGALTIFATHYHELTSLVEKQANVANFSVAVRENESGVVFLHKIVPGGIDRSYGIEVAKLAGLPKSVISRAKTLLSELEAKKAEADAQMNLFSAERSEEQPFPKRSTLETELADLDLNQLTPLAALQALAELQEKCRR